MFVPPRFAPPATATGDDTRAAMTRVEKSLALARPPTINDDILTAMARVEKSLAIVLAEVAKMQTQPPLPIPLRPKLGSDGG